MPAAEEGRYRVGSLYRPTPVPGGARSTLSQERAFYFSQEKPSNTGLPV